MIVLLLGEQRVRAAEGVRFRSGESGARAPDGVVRNAGDEIRDSAMARTIDPDAAFHSIGVAGVADEHRPARAHVVGAAGQWSRDLLRREPVAAVEATIGDGAALLGPGDAVASVEAPNLRQHRRDGLR